MPHGVYTQINIQLKSEQQPRRFDSEEYDIQGEHWTPHGYTLQVWHYSDTAQYTLFYPWHNIEWIEKEEADDL